jgi:hypothetical protein
MEARLIKLEDFAADAKDRLVKIETRLEQRAAKTDLTEKIGDVKVEIHKTANEMIRWVVGTAVVLGVAAITVMTFVLNNAVPKPPAAPVPQPIVIYAQSAPAPQAKP